MKKIFVTVLIFIGAGGAFADMRFDAKAWNSLQRFDVRTLSKQFESHVGQLVEVHFNFRSKDLHHLKPGWYESAIWQPDPQGRKGFSDVRVMVGQKDLKLFKTLPTDSTSSADLTVFGKVLHDSDNNFVFVRLIGRKAVVDPAGNVTVTW